MANAQSELPSLSPPCSEVKSSEVQTREVKILDDLVVNQIAAGEVVERPVSVVKELVENSVDAGATEISVAITNGGQSSILIVDDGIGMNRADALVAIQRFGTSKVSTVEDLFALSTHGFRGEAIPSIASVSVFELSTSARSSAVAQSQAEGTRILIEGGELKDVSAAKLAPGTRIEVRQLFFNVPARRKFLRTAATETGLVKALLIDFALAYPHIRFRLSVDGVASANYPPGGDLFRRAAELKLAGSSPLLCEQRTSTAGGQVVVKAALSQPIESVTFSGRLRLLVNNRSVRDKMLLKAVRDGYGNFLRPGRYPAGVLSLTLPAEDLDVNVHPQKTEVRFRRPEIVFGVIAKAVAKALHESASSGVVALPAENGSTLAGNAAGASSAFFSDLGREGFLSSERAEHAASTAPLAGLSGGAVAEATAFAFHPVSRVRRMRYVGQLLRCYLVFEGEECVALMDMHAAHERVMFFRLKTQLLGGAVHSQVLLLPESVSLPPEAWSRYLQVRQSLSKFGFEIEQIAESAVVVRAVPAVLSRVSPSALLNDLLGQTDSETVTADFEHHVDSVIARLACHRSIRSGREMEPEEAYELVAALEEADSSGYCPHGRPVVKILAPRELEAMFGRV